MLFSWAGFAIGEAEWGVEEDGAGEFAEGFEIADWAGEVVVTVEDEGFGELESKGSLGSARGTNNEERLGKARDKGVEGFHGEGEGEGIKGDGCR